MLVNICPIRCIIIIQTAWMHNLCFAFPKISIIEIMRNSDLFPQNYSLTVQVKLGDLKRQEKAEHFSDSRSNVDSKIVSCLQKHFRRCKDWEIIKIVSKTNLKPGSLPFSEFEISLLHRLQKHTLPYCSQKRTRQEKPVTVFIHQRYKAVLHNVWKWILDTQGLSSTAR